MIDAKNLHDVVVVAGDRVKFDLPFQGIPVPEVVWTLNGDEENPLATTSDKNMIITGTETSTKLIINNVTKKHAGKFQCTVSKFILIYLADSQLYYDMEWNYVAYVYRVYH